MVNKKGKGAKTKGSKPPAKKPQQENSKDLTQQSPQERVTLVRPFWETLEQEERVKLLSVELDNVRARAKQIAEAARQQAVADAPEGEPLDPALLELEPSIEDVLEEGIKRLKEKGTWKLWQWPADNAALYDAESFRQHITEKHIREELRRLLPRDEGRAIEKPAEAAFRQRMLDLLSKVQQSTSANSLRPAAVGAGGEDGAARPYRRRGDPGSHLRDANIELLSVMLEALAKENDHLYHSLLTPITTYVMEILPEGHRETTKLELSFEDLENLLPDDVSRIVEWLTEKVDALSTKLKPEPKDDDEEEEENMGDVDLWSLNEETGSLTVNAKWLQHLQDRLLGEDGHPRRAKSGEDPGRNGLVLEWVYGSIVSTAEKARDGAKRCLGMQLPTAADAHMLLVRALEEHLVWETRAKQCKDLLSEMLKSRLEATELTRQGYDLRPQPKRDLPGVGGDGAQAVGSPLLLEDGAASALGVGTGVESKPLPDEVILFMLRREALLTRAKLHFLVFEHFTQEKELRILKQALRQGEPEFERLKRELDEVKHQPRGMDGAYRNAVEMERHRHQLEVQTAFREQGARLQATYDKKQKAEYDMAKRETEIKQLQGWKGTVENLVDKFQELIACRNERVLAASSNSGEGASPKDLHEAEGDLEAASGALTPQQYIQLTKMRNHFIKDVRKQLYSDADDRTFFDNLKTALKAIERRLEDSSVALQHLEMQLINVACDDPGAIIGTQLALPLLQDRLDQRGLEYAAQRAKEAEDEVLRMELLAAEREAAERERKKAAKAKKNEKAKTEKERLAAERQAKEAAERAARQEAERERAVKDEEDRRKFNEAVEAMRKAEEAARELRRKELLSDENGYWRQRMIMEERLSDMAAGTTASAAAGAASSPDMSEESDRHRSSSPEDAHPGGDDEDGFVTDNRRRRHKDTRDQDEEVAAPAPAPAQGPTGQASSGSRAHLRSGSRDRMGPREGIPPRERGDQQQHPQRDREPRRHQGQAPNRSGSREGSGRQAAHSSGGAHRPPSAHSASGAAARAASPLQPSPEQPAAGVTSSSEATAAAAAAAAAAAVTVSVAEASASASPTENPLAPSSPAAAGPATEGAEQPAAPASAAPSPEVAIETQAAVASTASAGATLPSPSTAAVPEDAILFGDIAVIPVASGSSSGTTPVKTAVPPAGLSILTPIPGIPTPIPVISPPAQQQPTLESVADGQATTLAARVTTAPQQQQQLPSLPQPPQQPSAPSPQLQHSSTGGAIQLPGGAGPQTAPAQLQASAGPSAVSGAPMGPPPPPHAQGPLPLGTLPTGQVVHPIGHLPPGGLPGPMAGLVAPMMAHMAPPGPAGPPGAGPPRPPGPGAPPPSYIHVNGGIPVPIPAPGGQIPQMGPVMGKHVHGQQVPPQGPPVLVPIPPGARPPMPGPGMSAGPPPPGMAGPPPPQQQPAGPMGRPPGPMPMPGVPAGPGGVVQVPHPQVSGQPAHAQPHGVPPGGPPRGPAGPPGQPPVMLAPMQYPGPVPGGGMPMPHGQPPGPPMAHVTQHLYVFPPQGPGMVPAPGAPGQLQPHPHAHLMPMMPPGVPMPMGAPPQMHMQPPPQQHLAQSGAQGAPAVVSPGSQQPPPPPKSPAATGGGAKPGSTLNVNARSFVPGKVAAAAAAAAAAGGAAPSAAGHPSSQPPPSQSGTQPTPASSSPQQHSQQHPHGGPRAYSRQSSGGLTDGSSGSGAVPQPGHPGAAAYPRGGPAGPYGGPGQPGAVGGQYGSGRRDRRDGGRGGGGPRKAVTVAPTGPHGVMAPPADMAGGLPMPPPHPHAGPGPVPMMGPSPQVVMMLTPGPMQMAFHPQHLPHGPAMDPADGGVGVGPGSHMDRPPHHAPDMGVDESGRPAAADPSASQPGAGMPTMHGGHVPPGAVQAGVMAPPPPPGMNSRVMLAMPAAMPGPVQMPMMPMHMPMHMLPPAGGVPHPPSGGPVQKNGSAAESVRAPLPEQPQAAAASAEADREGSKDGDDSAATATATAPNTQTNEDGGGRAGVAQQEGGPQSGPTSHDAPADQADRWAATAGRRDSEDATCTSAPTSATDSSAGPSTAASPAAVAAQQQRPQQQQRSSSAASSPAGGPPGRTATHGQAGPPPTASSAPSWSSVAARRDGSVTSSASGHSLDPFPSLVPSAASTSSTAGGGDALSTPTAGSAHPPSAHSSWKAKLQQNVAAGAAAPPATASAAGGAAHKSSPLTANGVAGGSSPPVVVRGSSPHSTMNGNVSLASSLSDSAIANGTSVGSTASGVAAPTAPQRPPGNRPSGSVLLSGAPTQLIGSLSMSQSDSGSSGGIVYHPGVPSASNQSRKLQLVRGLQNLGGQHNCFLNVIIQSLWHLRSFRDAVLQLKVDDVVSRGAAAADVTVLRALVGVFRAMAAPLTPPPAVNAAAAPQPSPSPSPSWVVSPLELREALSVLETGQAAVRLDLSEMHDAFEVLLVLLTCMHRAEAGSGALQGQDPQLPRRVRVRDIAAAVAASGHEPSGGAGAAAMANGHHPSPAAAVPAGYAAAVAGAGGRKANPLTTASSDSATGPAGVPCTVAHTLFGLEVQVPCAADEDSASGCCGANGQVASKDRQQQQRPRRDSTGGTGGGADPSGGSGVALVPAPVSPPPLLPIRAAGDDPASAEVEVYTKYFHLVHAQALRKAFAALDGSEGGAYFEDVLCAAEAAGAGAGAGPLVLPVTNGRRATGTANGHGNAQCWTPGATAAAHPLATLLRLPTVFTLAIVWESLQAPLDSLRGTLEALGPRVDLALLFRCTGPHPSSAPCELRSVICYFGHHYLVFAYSEELALWLMIDDANIQLVGHWSDVAKAMCAKRLQPSLLLYEATGRGRQQPPLTPGTPVQHHAKA